MTSTFTPIVANSHIAVPFLRDSRMPPSFLVESGEAVEPFTAALKPMAMPSTRVKRTTCSICAPSDPVTALERVVTA